MIPNRNQIMANAFRNVVVHLLSRLGEVQRKFGLEQTIDPVTPLAYAVDSMGLVEFIGVIAEDAGVSPEVLERTVNHKFGTVAELAYSLHAAGLTFQAKPTEALSSLPTPKSLDESDRVQGWLLATAARLPEKVQSATKINQRLGRPPGWLEKHAGIHQRRVWAKEDPLAAASEAAREALSRSGLSDSQVGALLVTSEAPPMPVGLAAALHHRLKLPPAAIALEIGGACTGYLAAWCTALKMLPRLPVIVIVSLECHSRYLRVRPGPAGEAAALFGDAAAACVLSDQPLGSEPIPIQAVDFRVDGSGGGLLRVERGMTGDFALHMQGVALAGRAVRVMAQSVLEIAKQRGLEPSDLAAVIPHGGNGRLPGMLALQLRLSPDRIWSQTANTGNVGSASLPVAWALQTARPPGPVVWTAVGAGLTWGAALTGKRP